MSRVNFTMIPDEAAFLEQRALEQRARRTARSIGLIARKSRWRRDTIDNYGGFQICDPYFNTIVAGVRFDLSAEAVLEYCNSRKESGVRVHDVT